MHPPFIFTWLHFHHTNSWLCVQSIKKISIHCKKGRRKNPPGVLQHLPGDISPFSVLPLSSLINLSPFQRHLPPPHSPPSASSCRVRDDLSIYPGRKGEKLHQTSLITCAHMHSHTLTTLITALSFFNVCKPIFISVPCIMALRCYHQRQASLTKWERQIDCSIRREGPLSGDLMASH